LIGNNYEVDCLLGEGAFAEVYRVKHRFLGRQAMKVFKAVGMSLREAETALTEAATLSRIGHPNVIRMFDASLVQTTAGECAYFTMEYVAGGTLEDYWKSHGAAYVPVESTVEIMRQICLGLRVAHRARPPIIHRDIKPQNILVGYEATGLCARLSDFGLAKRVDPLTLLASAQGTRAFKAPEVFRNADSDSAAGDIWGLGCTLYLLLTDQLPYPDRIDIERTGAPPPLAAPSTINANVDKRLDAIALKALALKPANRYADAHAMLVDLEAWKRATKQMAVDSGLSDFPKEAFGPASSAREDEAQRLADRALRLARTPGRLTEAADLMEEAITMAPLLRGKYEYRVQLWRRRVIM